MRTATVILAILFLDNQGVDFNQMNDLEGFKEFMFFLFMFTIPMINDIKELFK